MAPARIQIPYLGEHYSDLLFIEAWLKDKSVPAEAQSLLCCALMRRESVRAAILSRLAAKRNTDVETLTRKILMGEARHMTNEEYAALQKEYLTLEEDEPGSD